MGVVFIEYRACYLSENNFTGHLHVLMIHYSQQLTYYL